VRDLDGKVLLLGVGHDANSTLHLAELVAGVPYGVRKHCTLADAGQARRIEYTENDHCCARFALADEWLGARGLQSAGPVASAHARLARSRDIVACAVEQLRREPLVFLHPRAEGCDECDAARDSVSTSGA
jgi:aminoglycoside N3'-acetyltransferase